jgi:hypothetical protein
VGYPAYGSGHFTGRDSRLADPGASHTRAGDQELERRYSQQNRSLAGPPGLLLLYPGERDDGSCIEARVSLCTRSWMFCARIFFTRCGGS